MKLEEIANCRVVTLDRSDSIDRAIALMEEHDIHHLPVVDEAGPAGMVSDRDMLTAVGWLFSSDRITGVEGPAFVGPTRVAHIMSSPILVLSPDDPVEEAARIMLRERISAIPLARGNRIVGIVAETDFLKCFLDHRTIARGSAWRFQKVADHMATDLFSLKPNDAPREAYKMMRDKQVRHLPVVEKDRLAGIVSDRDIRRSLGCDQVELFTEPDARPRPAKRTLLRDIMNPRVETVQPSVTLAEAADRMVNARIGALPVIDTQDLVGIITETDLVRAFLAACEK